MKKYILILFAFVSCNPKLKQVITETGHSQRIDTVLMWSDKKDSIPCDDFQYSFVSEKTDTIKVEVVKNIMTVKTVVKHDTIFRDKIIITPAKVVNKNNGNIRIKAKDGSAIGDGNKIDNRKNDRFWLGVLVTLGIIYLLKIGTGILSTYFPVSAPVISVLKKILPI